MLNKSKEPKLEMGSQEELSDVNVRQCVGGYLVVSRGFSWFLELTDMSTNTPHSCTFYNTHRAKTDFITKLRHCSTIFPT